MKNQITWKDNKGVYYGEAPAGLGVVNYEIVLSETVDENGPYFNVRKKYNNNEHYYDCDIDGMELNSRPLNYKLEEAKARCEKDYAIVSDKSQLEWFFASGGGKTTPKDYANSLFEIYAFNRNDGGEYRIYSDLHNDGITDEEMEDQRYYSLIKLEKSGVVRVFEKDYLTYERCCALAQEDLRSSEKNQERE